MTPKEPELITVKEAVETLNLSEDYVRKIKDKLPHVKQGNSKQGRLLFVKEGLMEAYLNSKYGVPISYARRWS